MNVSGNLSVIPEKEIRRVRYSMISKEDILTMSVCQVTSPEGIENGPNIKDSLYDKRMGSGKRDYICTTCGCTFDDGCGHPGHISLATPIFHPNFVDISVKLLNIICYECGRILISDDDIKKLLAREPSSRTKEIKKLATRFGNTGYVCRFCGFISNGKINFKANGVYVEENIDNKKTRCDPIKTLQKFENVRSCDLALLDI